MNKPLPHNLLRFIFGGGFLKNIFKPTNPVEKTNPKNFKSLGLFFVFILLPFLCFAQFPYNEPFRGTKLPSDVVVGGSPSPTTAFLTAGTPPGGGTPIDADGSGYLRLTNNNGNQTGFIYSNNVFPGTFGLNIEFEYYTYGGNGADGICFFLFDGSVNDANFNIGGFGGSLGYAQLSGAKGVSKGYLGVGLDEWGNFSNPDQWRQGGSKQLPSSVTVRGAGDGAGVEVDPTNYPWISTVQTENLSNPFNIAGNSRTAVNKGDVGYRKVYINLKPVAGKVGLLLNVSIIHDGDSTNIISDYQYTTKIPAGGLKYGISSSTGGNNNFHEIRGLNIVVDPSALLKPIAVDDESTGCQGQLQTKDILTNDGTPNAGGAPNPANVNLDPPTNPAIGDEKKHEVTTADGTFTFVQNKIDPSLPTQILTFTPAPDFNGTTSINYNYMDIYGALSSTAKATFTTIFPKITAQPQSNTICAGNTFTSSVTANNNNDNSSLSYKWQYYDVPTTTWVDISGQTASTLTVTNVTIAISGRQYRVLVTANPNSCSAVSTIATLTVNPLPIAAIAANVSSVCQNGTAPVITFSGSVGAAPYIFTYTINDGAPQMISSASSSNQNEVTVDVPTDIVGDFSYKIISISDHSSTQCSNPQAISTIVTVNPLPIAAIAANVSSVCQNGAAPVITFSGSVGAAPYIFTYTINNGAPQTISSAAGSSSVTVSQPTAIAGDFVYKIISISDHSSTQCSHDQTVQSIITINPTATVNTPVSQVKCNGASTDVITFTSTVDQTTYSWTNDHPEIGLAASGTGAVIPEFPAINTTGTIIIAKITVTPNTPAGCQGLSKDFTITVNPNTALQLTSAAANQTLCIHTDLTPITYSTTDATSATAEGLPAGITGSFLKGVLTISGIPIQSGTFTYTVTASGTCNTTQLTGIITVNPQPIGFNDVITDLSCGNTSFNYNLQDNVNNTGNGGNAVPASFTWTVALNSNVSGTENGSGNSIQTTLVNISHTVQHVTYTITPTSKLGGCPGEPFTLTVNVPVCSDITITKTADVNVVSQAGDLIRYTITIKNTASANHTNVQVTDPFLGGILTGPVSGDNGNGILEAEESWVYTGTYTVTQADLNNNGKPAAGTGNIINTATVNTAEHPGLLSASSTVGIVTTGSLTLVKTGVVSRDFSAITYTFTITNTGRVRLHNLNLEDLKTGGKVTLSADVIEVGATITATVTYNITEQEKRDGLVTNTATVTGNTPAGDDVSDVSGTQQDNNTPTVVIIDDAPTAIHDSAETKIDQPVSFTITGNDLPSFNGLDAGSVVITRFPAHGQVQVHPDGTVTYTPDKGYGGLDDFTYTVTDLKGKVSNKALVNITVTLIDLVIPNTFTPNGDGKNDTFKIIGKEDFDGIDLVIVNRWGNEVYRNKNYQDNWDGSGLSEGTYYYIIVLKKGATQVVKKGWILLKR